MAITKWPEELQPETCAFGRVRNDVVQESPVSRSRQIHRRGRPLWNGSFSFKVHPKRVSEMRYQLEAAHTELASTLMRDYAAVMVTRTESVKMNSAASEGSASISTKGWTASATGVVAAGQYIQVGSRLYTVSASANANGSGVATISLRTPIVAAAEANADVEIRTPACAMRPTSQDWSGSRSSDEALWSVDVDFVERVF